MTTLELSILDCGAVGKLGVVQRVFDMLGKTNIQGSACFGNVLHTDTSIAPPTIYMAEPALPGITAPVPVVIIVSVAGLMSQQESRAGRTGEGTTLGGLRPPGVSSRALRTLPTWRAWPRTLQR